jgi:hypothetical protein
MKRSFLRQLWTLGGTAAFIAAVLSLVMGKLGPAVMLLIVSIVCLGTAMAIARSAARRAR